MNGLSYPNIGTMIQGLTVFVAISILLGRIYHLTYFATLGIPNSEVSLNIIDYSVISPNVTFLGVGITILLIAYFWGMKVFTLPSNWHGKRIGVGAFLAVVSVVLDFLARVSLERFVGLEVFSSGLFGLILLLSMVLLAVGIVTLASGFPLQSIARFPSQRIQSRNVGETYNIVQTFKPLIIFIIGVLIIVVAVMNSWTIGRLDARNTILNAPQAKIEFTSASATDILTPEPDKCQMDSAICDFRVILIGDKFVYLRSVNSEQSREEQRLYAFPIGDIGSIVYVSSEKVSDK